MLLERTLSGESNQQPVELCVQSCDLIPAWKGPEESQASSGFLSPFNFFLVTQQISRIYPFPHAFSCCLFIFEGLGWSLSFSLNVVRYFFHLSCSGLNSTSSCSLQMSNSDVGCCFLAVFIGILVDTCRSSLYEKQACYPQAALYL